MNNDDRRTFVNAADMLDNLRDNNMTTLDSVCELVDNSLDHNAKNIWIDFNEDPKTKTIWMTVQDDGDGIKSENLKRALALGSSMNPRYSHKIGRFGMGLSSACASQSPKSILVSKTKEQEKIMCNEIDFDYLKQHEAIFPNTYELVDEAVVSKIKFRDSGTMVYWIVCDNLDKKKSATLHKHLIENLSRIYRHFLNLNRKIFINDKEVKLFDPLCRLQNHMFSTEYGIQKLYGEPIIIPIKYISEEGNEEVSKVVVDLVLLDYDKIEASTDLRNKLQIGMRSQGLYLIRNNREIDNPQWYNVMTQKIDHLNYIRGEIRFDSYLDKYFGIGHNKSKAYPKEEVLEVLKKELKSKIDAALSEHKRKTKQKKETSESGSDTAKNVYEGGTTLSIPEEKLEFDSIQPSATPIKKKTQKEIKKELEDKVDKNPLINNEIKSQKKETLRKVLESKYKEGILVTNDGPNAPIFRIEYYDGKKLILINGDHKFYEYVYEPSTNSRYAHPLVDLVFYCLSSVKEELQDERTQIIFDEVMARFSKKYGVMLNQKDFAEILTEVKLN